MNRMLAVVLALACFFSAALLNLAWTQRAAKTATAEWAIPDAPSTPAINLLLGGFRGIVTDWLWLRVMFLQEQGRYLELAQLAEWITALQPQFPDIWILQAWNLAYNVSVLMPTADQRWPWVQQGLDILRHQAGPATGYDPRICAETAWVLMHKIGGQSDDFSDAYLVRWIDQQNALLLADGHLPPRPQREPVAKAFGLPGDFLSTFDDQFGPLDWRHPVTHAAAWAYLGTSIHPDQSGTIRCRRLFAQSLRHLLFYGSMSVHPQTRDLWLTPDFDRLDAMLEAFHNNAQQDVPSAIPEAYRLTLEHTIRFLAAHAQEELAQKVFQILQNAFPDAEAVRAGFGAWTNTAPDYAPIRIPLPKEE